MKSWLTCLTLGLVPGLALAWSRHHETFDLFHSQVTYMDDDDIDAQARYVTGFNATLSVEPYGNITFESSYVRARKDRAPTVWNLQMDCDTNSVGWLIQAIDPAERHISWQGGSGRVVVSGTDYARYVLLAEKRDSKSGGKRTDPRTFYIMGPSGYCLSFDDSGWAQTMSNSACHPITVRALDQVTPLENPLENCKKYH